MAGACFCRLQSTTSRNAISFCSRFLGITTLVARWISNSTPSIVYISELRVVFQHAHDLGSETRVAIEQFVVQKISTVGRRRNGIHLSLTRESAVSGIVQLRCYWA
jgi:hypothetical protein